MKERWLPVGVIAGVLFVINVVARWVAKGIDDADKESVAGMIELGVIGLFFLVMAAYWGRTRPIWRVVTDLAILRRLNGEFVIDEVADGFTFEEVRALTDMDVKIPTGA